MFYKVPEQMKKSIAEFGGLNPFGKPHYRLIVASDRMVKEAGVWQDWQEGLASGERGGMVAHEGGLVPSSNKPIRVVSEMREVCRYPHLSGWIIERWFPSSTFGTREQWDGFVAVDGITPILGPYPAEGDYDMLPIGPWQHMPSIETVRIVVRSNIQTMDGRVGTPEARAREFINRRNWENEQKEKKKREAWEYQLHDSLTPMHSSSLGASRWRNEVAKRAGITEHIGII